jgi:hypothetical protein
MSLEQPLPVQPPRTRFGALVVLGTLIVATLATVLAGMSLSNALDGRLRDRAVWGVLVMAVGAAGPLVAVATLVRSRRIVEQVEGRRWGAVALFPGSFVALWVLVFLGYAVLGDGPQTPIIPNTPKFVVRFSPEGDVGFATFGEFGSAFEGRGESRANGVLTGDISVEYRVHPDASGESPVAFEGALKPPSADRAELHGTLVLKVKVRMRIEGLDNAALTIDDQPREFPLTLEPGRYRIVIRGTPRKD